MSFDSPVGLRRLGSAKRLTRTSSFGHLPEMDNPVERWL